MGLFDIEVEQMDGKKIKINEFKNKVILVVNTASRCGYTPQFESLERLYNKYKDKDFVILGFPCNQFANQDPKSDEEILSFCSLNYGVTFPMFKKINVNGVSTHPLFKYLKNHKRGAFGPKIMWNFTKFLIDRDGKIIKRYAPNKKPEVFEEEIVKLL